MENIGVYFIDFKLYQNTISHSDISISSDRQANDMEELLILNNTTVMKKGDRKSETTEIESKVKAIFGDDSALTIELW